MGHDDFSPGGFNDSQIARGVHEPARSIALANYRRIIPPRRVKKNRWDENGCRSSRLALPSLTFFLLLVRDFNLLRRFQDHFRFIMIFGNGATDCHLMPIVFLDIVKFAEVLIKDHRGEW